jgi:hypothetical protein
MSASPRVLYPALTVVQTLSILGGLLGRTSGSVLFADAAPKRTDGRPAPGDVGLVPQKNVLFAELSVLQNLRVWAAVKRPAAAPEDLEQLLRDCDLGAKIHARAGTLSGGQKRKLQLAAGLVGGSPSESEGRRVEGMNTDGIWQLCWWTSAPRAWIRCHAAHCGVSCVACATRAPSS